MWSVGSECHLWGVEEPDLSCWWDRSWFLVPLVLIYSFHLVSVLNIVLGHCRPRIISVLHKRAVEGLPQFEVRVIIFLLLSGLLSKFLVVHGVRCRLVGSWQSWDVRGICSVKFPQVLALDKVELISFSFHWFDSLDKVCWSWQRLYLRLEVAFLGPSLAKLMLTQGSLAIGVKLIL